MWEAERREREKKEAATDAVPNLQIGGKAKDCDGSDNPEHLQHNQPSHVQAIVEVGVMLAATPLPGDVDMVGVRSRKAKMLAKARISTKKCKTPVKTKSVRTKPQTSNKNAGRTVASKLFKVISSQGDGTNKGVKCRESAALKGRNGSKVTLKPESGVKTSSEPIKAGTPSAIPAPFHALRTEAYEHTRERERRFGVDSMTPSFLWRPSRVIPIVVCDYCEKRNRIRAPIVFPEGNRLLNILMCRYCARQTDAGLAAFNGLL